MCQDAATLVLMTTNTVAELNSYPDFACGYERLTSGQLRLRC